MPPSAVHALLSRIANDEPFRQWLQTDPEAALRGWDLTPEEQQLAREGGEKAMALLSWEATGRPRPAPSSQNPQQTGTDQDGTTPMPSLSFLVNVCPTPHIDDNGQPCIAHVASLLPHQPDTQQPDGACFVLSVNPLAQHTPDGQVHVHYTASIDPVTPSPMGKPTTGAANTSRQGAIDGVHSADEEHRFAAIMNLIRELDA